MYGFLRQKIDVEGTWGDVENLSFLSNQSKPIIASISHFNDFLAPSSYGSCRHVMPLGYVREISYSPRNKSGLRRTYPKQGPATASGAGGAWAAAGLIAQPEKRQYLPAVAGDGKARVFKRVVSVDSYF